MSYLGSRADRAWTVAQLERVALDVRRQLWRDVPLLEPIPIERLRGGPHRLTGPFGAVEVVVKYSPVMPRYCWVHTSLAADGVTRIRCNWATWEELAEERPRTRFGLAHELGHALLHAPQLRDVAHLSQDPDVEDDNEIERQANRFAAHLLCPDKAIAYARRQGLEVSAWEIGERWGMGPVAAQLRMDEVIG